MEEWTGIIMVATGIVILLVMAFVYFLPTIIAFNRKHHYKWIVFAINLVFGVTGIGYAASLVWALWPRQTSVIDPLRGDPTDNSLEACKQYYQKRGEIDRAYDQARHPGNLFPLPQQMTPQQSMPSAENRQAKACPFCGEDIHINAVKCKHCQSMLKP